MTLDSDKRRKLQKQGHDLKATMQIGKGGLSDGLKEELTRQLKAKRLVKVKLLESGREAGSAEQLADEVQAELIEKRGHTILLWRAKGN